MVNDVLAGVKVLEVAAWTFVPAAGAVLAEWGADVIKVEHPVGGDPQRGLITMRADPRRRGRRQLHDRGAQPRQAVRSASTSRPTGGREVLLKLAAESDVFLTNFLPHGRGPSSGIDVDDIRAVNPDIIYVRGSGHGPKGQDADKPGLRRRLVLVARRRSPTLSRQPAQAGRSVRGPRSATSWAA